MPTSTDDTTVVIPQSLNALEVNERMAKKITDAMKSQYSSFTSVNKWNKSENGDISHSIHFRKGWFEGFDIKVAYMNAKREVSLLVNPDSKLEGSIFAIFAIPIALIVFFIATQYIRSSYKIENLSLLGVIVSLGIGIIVGGIMGYSASTLISKIIIPKDVKIKNEAVADTVLETCISIAQEFVSNYAVPQVTVQSPSQAPVQIPQVLEQTATAQTISLAEKNQKVDKSKLCPRCYTESNTFFICKECGYVNKTMGGGLFLIALIGLVIGTHGLLAWIAAENTLWVEIVKTLLCGFPGVLLAYWGITEMVYIAKSKQWTERHNYDMNELINFYKKNPNASSDEAGKFFNRTGQWVQLMLSESESKKE